MVAKLTTEEFIRRANIIHDNKYNYLDVQYKNCKTKVKIGCPVHGPYLQLPDAHLYQKSGCPDCGMISAINSHRTLLSDFIFQCNIIYHNQYDYSLIDKLVNIKAKVEIICKLCKFQFSAIAYHHLHDGQKCPNCRIKNGLEAFKKECTIKHNGKYDYLLIITENYFGSKTKVPIICTKCCNTFIAVASMHKFGSGCPHCSHKISKVEIDWLDSLAIPNDIKHRQVTLALGGKRVIVDGFDPATKTVYEFNGDYYHGNISKLEPNAINHRNKKTFLELYLATMEKERLLKEYNYRVISIWESDWRKQQKQLKQVQKQQKLLETV